jgi:Ca-activated chloride channel family protein
MDWLHPHLFWVFFLVPAAALLAIWATRRRSRLLARFGGRTAVSRLTDAVSQRRRRWKSGGLVVAAALLCLALVGPRFGTQIREVKREGVDLVIALDVSLSMQAEDVAPSRLARSKNEIKNLLDDLRGDRVGLVLFAGDAFLQCPLTTDYSAVKLFLDVANPSLIPTPGTDFVSAMRMAMQAFERAGNDEFGDEERTRALLFVSDGENHIDGINAALSEARSSGVIMYAAGVGETEGAPIPVSRSGGQVAYKKDSQGRIVSTRLHEDVLKELAQDGAYFRIARTSSSLNKITAALDRLDKSEFGSEEFEEYDEKYQWPLALGVLLLMVESLVSDRVGRRRRSPAEPVSTSAANS